MGYSSKFIASGSYGCAIRPGYNCNNNNTQAKTVSKLFSSKTEWEYEIEQNNLIRELDNNNKFTIKMISSCKIDKHFIKNNVNNIDKCDIIDEEPVIYQIVYEDGGKDLRDLFTDNDLLVYYPHIDIKEFLKKMLNIFEGLKQLEARGITHRDVKLDNLLYDGNKITLIDFGLALKKTEVYSVENLRLYRDNKVYYYPNEPKLYTYKKYNMNFDKIELNTDEFIGTLKGFIKRRMIEKLQVNSDNLREINSILNGLKDKNLQYMEEFKKLSNNEFNKIDLIKFDKMDTYLSGVVLMEILTYITFYISSYMIPQSLFVLIYSMLEPNPLLRPSMSQVVESYRQIINN